MFAVCIPLAFTVLFLAILHRCWHRRLAASFRNTHDAMCDLRREHPLECQGQKAPRHYLRWRWFTGRSKVDVLTDAVSRWLATEVTHRSPTSGVNVIRQAADGTCRRVHPDDRKKTQFTITDKDKQMQKQIFYATVSHKYFYATEAGRGRN